MNIKSSFLEDLLAREFVVAAYHSNMSLHEGMERLKTFPLIAQLFHHHWNLIYKSK